jgi:cytochrome b6-f complex iron-sulfur subunit
MNDHREKEAGRKIQRREFLKAVAASGGAAACGSLLAGCAAPAAGGGGGAGEVTLDLTLPANRALAAVGGTLTLDANELDSKGMLLYRSSESELLAFSRKCTHTGCTLAGFVGGISSCPCHGSQFGTDGKPSKGPAAQPLKAYTAALSGSTLTIKG